MDNWIYSVACSFNVLHFNDKLKLHVLSIYVTARNQADEINVIFHSVLKTDFEYPLARFITSSAPVLDGSNFWYQMMHVLGSKSQKKQLMQNITDNNSC